MEATSRSKRDEARERQGVGSSALRDGSRSHREVAAALKADGPARAGDQDLRLPPKGNDPAGDGAVLIQR